ncbi:MAG: hypothetical protein M3Z64_11545 [Verrucomicrobiota bacterium]|nr:hypothetical protein [Verrucomicrobiota bacterium]
MTFLKKILLVDHESALTDLVRRALESTGKFLVKVERDDNLALHAAPWFLPDLILLDSANAEAGIAASSRYLAANPTLEETPVLFLSGSASAGKRIATSGVISGYSFLASPMRIEELGNWIEDLIGGNRARQLEVTTR